MFCFRCGNELPPKVVLCPICDTPQKRRSRRHRRLLIGLVLFMSGAFVGSFIDSVLFRGKSWEASPALVREDPESANVLPEEKPASTAEDRWMTVVYSAPDAAKASGMVALPPTTASAPGESGEMGARLASISEAGVLASGVVESSAGVASMATEAVAAPIIEVASLSPVVVEAILPKNYRLELDSVSPMEEGPGTNFHGSISADGRMLIFSSNRTEGSDAGKFQCYFRELPQVGPVTRLFPWEGNVWTPEFSRMGQTLVFSSDSTAKEHVFLRDLAHQQTRKLTDGSAKNMMPAISPDGNLVAFVSNRKGNNDIWLIGADGSGLIQVTSGAEDDREPRWAADGQSLVFTRIKEPLKVSQIMRIDLNPMGPPVELIKEKARNWLADPSPDGKYLAYVRSEKTGGSGNVIRIRSLERNDEVVLAPFKGGEHFRPIWTADGQGLVFHAERQKAKHLFLAKLKRIPLP